MSRRKRLRETFTIGGAPQPARTRRAPREDRQVNADVRPSPGTGVGRVRFAGQDVADAVSADAGLPTDMQPSREAEGFSGIDRADDAPSMSFLVTNPAPFTEELNKELRKEVHESSPKTPPIPSSTKRRKRGKR